MKKIYLYNNRHNGDLITNRCLVRKLLDYDLDIAVGSYRNRHYLVADLPVRHIISPHDEVSGQFNQPASPCLSTLCPEGYVPINTWCGTFPDIDAKGFHNWRTIVGTFNRWSDQYGLGIHLSDRQVPMVDWEVPCHIRVCGRGIYVENGEVRSGHTSYEFDMESLALRFPEFVFYCTANPRCQITNVVDCSQRNLIELSHISNQCEAIVGKGSGPFLCTYTEINRLKPKAVMQFRAPAFWEYRNNPLQYLETTEQLCEFLYKVSCTLVEFI